MSRYAMRQKPVVQFALGAALLVTLLMVAPARSGGETSKWHGYLGGIGANARIDIRLPVAPSNEADIWVGGDGGEVAKFCDAKSKYYCFRSIGFAFLASKSIGETETQWEHDGIFAEIIKRQVDVEILGRSLSKLTLIRAWAKNVPPSLYLFSPEYGLVAINPGADPERSTFWMQGDRGVFSE